MSFQEMLKKIAELILNVKLRGLSGFQVLGCITTGLCFIQPFMALLRCHPGTPKRPIFNWLHWFVGNAAHIIGIVAIGVFVSVTSAVVWFALKFTMGIRVDEEDEVNGLDRAELGMEAYPEFGARSTSF